MVKNPLNENLCSFLVVNMNPDETIFHCKGTEGSHNLSAGLHPANKLATLNLKPSSFQIFSYLSFMSGWL